LSGTRHPLKSDHELLRLSIYTHQWFPWLPPWGRKHTLWSAFRENAQL